MSEWNAHRFYFEKDGVRDGLVRLPEEEAHHALKVLRLNAGARVILTDGARGVYAAVIEEADRGTQTLVARLGQPLPDCEAKARVTLFQGVPKAGKMELIVQKCTELGVDAIQPVRMTRGVPEPERNPEKNLARLNRVAREAAKQCCRGAIPEVRPTQPLKSFESVLSSFDVLLVPWEDAGSRSQRIADVITPGFEGAAAVVIGPEGGMTVEEVDFLRACGGVPVTLGPRILRTETASMAAMTAVLTCSGDV